MAKSKTVVPPKTRQKRTMEALEDNHVDHDTDTSEVSAHEDLTLDRENAEPKWAPTDNLWCPDPPKGIEYRWVRGMSRDGSVDKSNLAKKKRGGWVPVKISQINESTRHSLATESLEGFGEIFAAGDLVLCQRDARMGQQRQAYYNGKIQDQKEAVKASMSKTLAGVMPLTDDFGVKTNRGSRTPRVSGD